MRARKTDKESLLDEEEVKNKEEHENNEPPQVQLFGGRSEEEEEEKMEEKENEEGEEDLEAVNEAKVVLKYFARLKDILWFNDKESISDTVIMQPMALIKSLRTVINHNVRMNFKSIKFRENGNDYLRKGELNHALHFYNEALLFGT